MRLFRVMSMCLTSALVLAAAQQARADYKQAVAYYMQGRYDKAIQELKPDLDQNPEWEFGHRLAGLCYLNLHNNALAVSSLTRAVQLKSTAFATYYGLGQAYFNMKEYDRCIQILNTGEQYLSSSKDPDGDRYDLRHLRGSALFRQDKFSEALSELTAAIRIKQNDWTDFSQLGIAYYGLGRYDDAIEALNKALSMKGVQGNLAEVLGKAYFKKGVAALSAKQYPHAIEYLQKAREQNPKDGFIYYNLAEAYLFQKKYADAERALNQALEIMPHSAEVYMRLGLVYEKQQKWDMSLNAYKKADDMKPSKEIKEAITRVSENKKK